jgi:2'-5' RNA ligase
VGAFPPKGPPRVVFAAIQEGHDALVALANDIDAACAALGHASESRPFHAHITLARAKPGPRIVLDRITPTPCDAGFASIESVTLFRSDPGPRGAAYTPIAVYRLGAALAVT